MNTKALTTSPGGRLAGSRGNGYRLDGASSPGARLLAELLTTLSARIRYAS